MLLNRSWGARGHPFTQHYSCPAVLRCYIVSLVAAFLGYLFVCDKVLPQSPSPEGCAQSARRQHPCCRRSSRWAFSHSVTVSADDALVACKHAPIAPRVDGSSSSSRRLVISLCPLRGHLKLSKTAPSECLLKKCYLFVEILRTKWFLSEKSWYCKSSLRQLSKVCDCCANAWVWKAVFAPHWFFQATSSRRHDDFQNCGGSAHSGQKSSISDKQNQHYTSWNCMLFINIFICHIKFILILF